MESFRGSGFSMTSTVATRRRSNTARRPRTDPHLFMEGLDVSTPPSTPSSDNVSKLSTESGSYDSSNQRKIFSLNTTNLKTSSINKLGGVDTSNRVRKDEKFSGQSDRIYGNGGSRSGLSGSSDLGRNRTDLKRCSDSTIASSSRIHSGDFKENHDVLMRSPDNYLSYGSGDGHDSSIVGRALNGSSENKLRKVKLKVGGVTHTLHTKSSAEGGSITASAKLPRSSDARHGHRLNLQDISDNDHSSSHGTLWKGFGGGNNGSRLPKEASRRKSAEETLPGKQIDTSEPVRKSKRIPKKRVLDGAFDEDEADEIKYLERLRIARMSADYGEELEGNLGDAVKNKKSSKNSKNRRPTYEEDEDFALSQRSKDGGKKSRSDMESEDMDYVEEEEQVSDAGPENIRRKQESLDSPDTTDDKKFSLTTRQRTLQSSKDGPGGNGATVIEFPNGLPPAPPRKQKGKLSEVEQQLKKAEAAQRRRMQVEKAARESEAEAIRKILGQDSSRKKREDKLRKKREELAQERASNSVLAPNYVRWVIGPNGTTVTFPEGADLPSIFNSPPCRYPPPREKCAGPSCTNAYKYRDSKSNLPLCSLQCYRAVQQNRQQLATC